MLNEFIRNPRFYRFLQVLHAKNLQNFKNPRKNPENLEKPQKSLWRLYLCTNFDFLVSANLLFGSYRCLLSSRVLQLDSRKSSFFGEKHDISLYCSQNSKKFPYFGKIFNSLRLIQWNISTFIYSTKNINLFSITITWNQWFFISV